MRRLPTVFCQVYLYTLNSQVFIRLIDFYFKLLFLLYKPRVFNLCHYNFGSSLKDRLAMYQSYQVPMVLLK